MNYLLDTDTLSFYLRGNPNIKGRILAASPDHLHIATISVMEIEYGLTLKPERRPQVEAGLLPLLQAIALVPFDTIAAISTAKVRAGLTQAGTPIGAYDVQLAGIALAHGLTLVTHNIREFSRVAGLVIEDWF
jgi:tRNA(fMet)-specific endonuclease VapC